MQSAPRSAVVARAVATDDEDADDSTNMSLRTFGRRIEPSSVERRVAPSPPIHKPMAPTTPIVIAPRQERDPVTAEIDSTPGRSVRDIRAAFEIACSAERAEGAAAPPTPGRAAPNMASEANSTPHRGGSTPQRSQAAASPAAVVSSLAVGSPAAASSPSRVGAKLYRRFESESKHEDGRVDMFASNERLPSSPRRKVSTVSFGGEPEASTTTTYSETRRRAEWSVDEPKSKSPKVRLLYN